MLTRLLVCAYMAAARLAELALSRRHLALGEPATEAESARSRAIYPAIIAVHTLAIAGTLLSGHRRSKPWLLALFAVQPLRLWVLLTLGRRWNARGAVSPETEVETGGPYAFVRHPNYAIVIAELALLPLVHTAWLTCLTLSALNAFVLWRRIPAEERMLFDVPGYREAMAAKKRFVPGLF